jgi:hypothetical protein
MNKTLGLVLASLFLLSMVVGVVSVQPTQAASGNPQPKTYIVPISLPYEFAVVVTNVSLGTNTSTIAQGLNETFSNTKLNLTISNSQYTYTVTVNGNTSYIKNASNTLNALGIYYSPAAKAVVMVFNLSTSKGSTYSALKLVSLV